MIGTIDDLKDYLGIEGSAQDDRLTAALKAGSAMVVAYCRRNFEQATYTDELCDGSGTDVLLLENYPLTAVSSVSEFGQALSVGTDPTGDFDVLWFADEGMLVRPFSLFFRARRWYKVTYTAGYTPTTMPAIILQAALDFAALVLKEPERVGIQNKTIGQQTTQFVRDLPAAVKAGLDSYRDLSMQRRVA